MSIRAEHLSKIFGSKTGDVLALDDICLTVPTGARISLLGPSGSGKTTLLHICASFEEPSSGRVFLDGQLVEHLRLPVRVGVVQQRDTLFPNMTIRENVLFGAKNDREIAGYWLDRVGLQDFRDKWPRELSGGMCRRAELVRALVHKPSVFLLDEPFSSLDVLTREEMQLLLLELWSETRLTALFATHDVEEAIFLGDEVFILSRGPGTIAAHFPVPFAYPRIPDLRLTRPFIELRAEITAQIRQVARESV